MVLLEGEDDVVDAARELRQERLLRQQLRQYDVPHSESDSRHRGAAEGLEQAVVAAAAADRAQLAAAVEGLEHDARVIGETADHRCVEADAPGDSVRVE